MPSLRRILLLSMLFFAASNAFAQINQYFIPGVFPQSPNSAAQAKYGDYQVSMFTGVPNISIPLYEVKSGDLSVPISLSYHASGVKVAEVASWVGLGWSLSSGGSISRQVMGRPDDVDGGYLNDNVIPAYGIDQSTTDGIHRAWNFVRGTIDGRPDMFSYDFPGQSGKFFFNGTDHSMKPVLLPFSPMNISYTKLTGSAKTITGFDIKDEHGNSYAFGKTYRETTSGSTPSAPSADYTSNWMLEKMISQNKRDTISFDFTSEVVSYPDESNDMAIVSDEVDNMQNGDLTYGYEKNLISISHSSVKAMLSNTINFKNGRVVFEKDVAYRQDLEGQGNNNFGLNKIKVYNYNFAKKVMELQKTIVFFKSYFNPSVQFARRLKLDSIQVLDKAGSIIQRYAFTYNESIALPEYSSRKKDFWGYYNGKNNTSLIPQQWVQYHPTPTNPMDSLKIGDPNIVKGRDPDSLFMQAAVLTDIRYPTGGKTHFNYQTNQYRDDNNVLKLAGGLRVTSIWSYANDAAVPVVKTYKYLSAHQNFILDNSYFYTQQTHQKYGTPPGSPGCQSIIAQKRVRTYVSNPSRDLTSIEGATVSYPIVEEYLGSPSGNVGKTRYVFTDFDSGSAFTYAAGAPMYNTYFYKRGLVEKKTNYKSAGNGTYQPVSEEQNGYGAFQPVTYPKAEMLAHQSIIALGAVQNPIEPNTCVITNDYATHNFTLSNRDIISGDNYKTSTTTITYDPSDSTKSVSSAVAYYYDNIKHQQITRVRTTDSKGNIKISVTKYPADYLSANGTTTNSAVLDTMLVANMQAEPIEKWDSLQNVTTNVNSVTAAQLNLFKAGNRAILPAAVRKLGIAAPVTDFIPATISSGNISSDSRYVDMINFDSYGFNGNALLQYTPKNAGPTYIIWDYNNQYPVAQVKNAVYANPGGNLNSAYTSFEADSKGNWAYTAAPVTARYSPTGKLVFPLSSGNISASNFDLSKPHVLTYWSDNGAASVYAGSNIQGFALRSVDGWTFYRHDIPALTGTNSITISGSGNIDELKTYPADAQMVTYTFDTDGLSAITDEKEQVSRFEYDAAQRLLFARDWENNILKGYDYHNYNMTVGNDAIPATTFTRDNCPAGTAGQSTTYSIAANTFYSSSKASANALAQYYLQQEGQKKANDPAICGCPIQYVTVTFKDQTGLGTYGATFSGSNSVFYSIPSGTSTKQIPAGTYTLQISAVGTQTKNFSLTGFSTVTGRTATFNNVNVSATGPALTLTIY